MRSISCHSYKKSQEIEAGCEKGFEKVDICLLHQDIKPSQVMQLAEEHQFRPFSREKQEGSRLQGKGLRY